MNAPRPARAVTFDFGQTLAEMDTAMLARRLGERGVTVAAESFDAATTTAWRAYNDAVLAGLGGHPWKLLMHTMLAEAGVAERRDEHVDWLWAEQPRANLWRRPIAGMIELVDGLRAAGVPVGVVSNSEGHLEGLIAEMGWSGRFAAVADSGALGIEKPDARIFRWAADRLGVGVEDCVHVGDAWAADFAGALGAGMRAVLFRGTAFVPDGDPRVRGERVAVCEHAHEVRAALARWGLPAA